MSKVSLDTVNALPKKIRAVAKVTPKEHIQKKGLGVDIFDTAVKQAGVMREKLLSLAKYNHATLDNTIEELKACRDKYIADHAGVEPSKKGEADSFESFKANYPEATQAQVQVMGSTIATIRNRVSEYILIIGCIKGGTVDSLKQAPSYQALLSTARQLKGSARKPKLDEAKPKEHLTESELERIMRLLDEANRFELGRIIAKAQQALRIKQGQSA